MKRETIRAKALHGRVGFLSRLWNDQDGVGARESGDGVDATVAKLLLLRNVLGLLGIALPLKDLFSLLGRFFSLHSRVHRLVR